MSIDPSGEMTPPSPQRDLLMKFTKWLSDQDITLTEWEQEYYMGSGDIPHTKDPKALIDEFLEASSGH